MEAIVAVSVLLILGAIGDRCSEQMPSSVRCLLCAIEISWCGLWKRDDNDCSDFAGPAVMASITEI
jgi:hypothetical protein